MLALVALSGAQALNVVMLQGKGASGLATEIDLAATITKATGTQLQAVISGNGNMTFKVDGVSLGSIGPLPFTNLQYNGSSKMPISGVTFTMPSDQTLTNIFNSGFSLVLTKGSKIDFTYNNGVGTADFSGGCTLTSPFKDSGGKALALTITKLTIGSGGSVDATGTIALPSAGFDVVGMTINASTGNGTWTYGRASGQKPTFQAAFNSVSAAITIPGLSSFDLGDLKVTVTDLRFDIDGKTTFSKATLASATPVKVSLPAPANAEVTLSSITLSESNGKLNGLTADGSLTLPSQFSAVDTSNGASPIPITVPNMSLVMVNGVPHIEITKLVKELDAFWNGFQLRIPPTPNPPFEVDLWSNYAFPDEVDAYGKPLPASWRGIFIKNAKVNLPASWGAGEAISVQNFAIGPDGGIYGTVTYTGGANSPVKYQIPGFAGTLTSLSVTFNAGDIVAGSGAGTIACSDFGVNLGVAVSFSTSGQTVVTVNTTQPIPISSLGMQLQIDQGTVTYDGNGKGNLSLSGALSFGDNPPGGLSGLANASLAVSGLNINSQGHVSISSVMVNCPNMQPVDVGPLSLTLQQFGFGQNTNGAWWVTFTGDVGISGLPISGQIGFNGLTITQGLNGALPSISLPSNIQISTDMDGVASIDVDISHQTYPVAGQKPAQPDWQAYNGPPIDVYSGLASVSLECFGPSGPGISLNFLASANSFFVLGDVELGQANAIILGQTPFSLFGFRGGFGINVEPDTPGATGIPSVDYQLIPTAPGASGNDIFVAGVRMGLADGFTLWGDLTLTLSVGSNFFIDLNGALYCSQDGVDMPIGSVPQDRVVSGDIVFSMPNGNPTLSANAQANFYLPDNASYNATNIGVYATGSLWFNLDQNGLALNVGGVITPANLGTGSAPSIQNPVTVYLMGIQGPAGAINIALPPPSGVYPIQAAATFSYSKDWNGSWGVFGGTINWNASATVNAWFWGAVTMPPAGQFSVMAGLGLGGSASFGVTGPFGLNVNGNAGFGGVLDATVTTSSANFSGDLGVTLNVCGFKHNFTLGFSWP